jgi:hypothetical protein
MISSVSALCWSVRARLIEGEHGVEQIGVGQVLPTLGPPGTT